MKLAYILLVALFACSQASVLDEIFDVLENEVASDHVNLFDKDSEDVDIDNEMELADDDDKEEEEIGWSRRRRGTTPTPAPIDNSVERPEYVRRRTLGRNCGERRRRFRRRVRCSDVAKKRCGGRRRDTKRRRACVQEDLGDVLTTDQVSTYGNDFYTKVCEVPISTGPLDQCW